ncbi:DASH family cryptochrome [Chamaesiphon polymorphus]|uniref:Cryptochrome DASH n=1 Tax=Chamaesiphon polymorphus CCALA 037 TaxID=2107692 RepID=A0A2T1FNJ4_9CYAN|nr:DASH family cryptochrome [Chamaesiphon polymorphus]PSB46548.1 cryptochrome DASH [Chamaesiphon polymorphus CCALA 037]
MTTKRILIWYRNDLRLHDHQPLNQALNDGASVIPFYCFDDRQFGQTSFGFPKTGGFRAQFLLESLADLQNSYRSLGSELIIRRGLTEEIIPKLVEPLGITDVYYHQEVTPEEIGVSTALEAALTAVNVNCRSFWGHTLHLLQDLPFTLPNLPELFTNFRKEVERKAPMPTCLPAPTSLPPLSVDLDPGTLPSLEDLGIAAPQPDTRGVLAYRGGETAGIDRLNEYIWQHDRLRVYKETRNGMLGADYSSKFSAWLALGCLSPRYIHQQVKKYEDERIENDSTYWLIFELLWRDYFRFICAKHGNNIFKRSGLQGVNLNWKQDWQRFDLWREGKTGYPLVDANMREIAATGYMSNRGRQNVASFLTKNLGIDWRMGAEWFESLLIDYDVCSNWGNWNYTAGVGNDARVFRVFNITKQSLDYDREGNYVKHWLPELDRIPATKVHEPWKLSPAEQENFGVRIGVDYPQPVVDLFKSARTNELIYNMAFNISGGARERPVPNRRSK